MKSYSINLVFLIAFLSLVEPIIAQPSPPIMSYWPECWRGEDVYVGYSEPYVDSGLVAFTSIGPNELGYPMRTSSIIGVSDTAIINIRLEKRRGGSYDISTVDPETWFTPVVYSLGMDRRIMPPVGDTSNFECQFLYWTVNNVRVPKPAELPPVLSGNKIYSLKYAVWGLPSGRFILTMKETESAPTAIKLCINDDVPVWLEYPMDMSDSVSAFAGCFWRAVWADSLYRAEAWTDTILNYNQQSLVGYRAKAHVLKLLNQQTDCLVAFDSVLTIAARYGDPALPDSSDLTPWQRRWYSDLVVEATFSRWCVENGRFPSYR